MDGTYPLANSWELRKYNLYGITSSAVQNILIEKNTYNNLI